jgi:hypothetical protein
MSREPVIDRRSLDRVENNLSLSFMVRLVFMLSSPQRSGPANEIELV